MTTVHPSGVDLSWIRDLPERMEERGLSLAGPEADVWLVGDAPQPDRPHILVADCDAADLYDKPASQMLHPKCIGAVKSYRLEKWDAPAIDGRHFVTHLPNAPMEHAIPGNVPPKPVAGWLSYIHLPRMAPAVAIAKKILRKGRIGTRRPQAWFAGTTRYGAGVLAGILITAHREAVAGHGASVPLHKYLSAMREASVALSPFGWGEACWRDWEAMLCGCAVVKPACPWVRSATGLYQGDRLVWCWPGWGDIEAAIEKARGKSDDARLADIAWALNERRKAGAVVASAIAEVLKA